MRRISKRKSQPCIFLDSCTLSNDQIRDKLPESLKVGKSKISSILKKMKWTKKRMRQILNERNSQRIIEQRKIYASIVSIRPDSDLIFLDETGIKLHCTEKVIRNRERCTKY
ncbi:MAG: hypothetical protein MHMPM18_004261 [Marteilia pararefringens]